MAYIKHASKQCDIPARIVRREYTDGHYYHKDTNERYYGVAGTTKNDRYLFLPCQWTQEHFTAKKNCRLFRYSSPATETVGLFPIVSVNEERGLVYFWYTASHQWDSKGSKLDYLCIHDGKA